MSHTLVAGWNARCIINNNICQKRICAVFFPCVIASKCHCQTLMPYYGYMEDLVVAHKVSMKAHMSSMPKDAVVNGRLKKREGVT